MCQNETAANGWSSIPANAGKIFSGQPFNNDPEPLSIDNVKFPFDDPVVAKTFEYAQKTLPRETLHHSMRVYFYGMPESPQNLLFMHV